MTLFAIVYKPASNAAHHVSNYYNTKQAALDAFKEMKNHMNINMIGISTINIQQEI